ncbi:MAG: hypothetical protein K5780_03900 [Alphaproteobacteria bacterium]|nr:hypothetical protein [Alphaproteobacteria bacterium]
MSETFQDSPPNVCGAKTKFGRCLNPPMENGRCRLHGGLTPSKHPNHQARLNALKTGRNSSIVINQIKSLRLELYQLDQTISEGISVSKGCLRVDPKFFKSFLMSAKP